MCLSGVIYMFLSGGHKRRHAVYMVYLEKCCLKWNDFQENIGTSQRFLRTDNELTDVTLACEDRHQIQAHKVMQAASRPFFQNIFKLNKHAHPLIYMRPVWLWLPSCSAAWCLGCHTPPLVAAYCCARWSSLH